MVIFNIVAIAQIMLAFVPALIVSGLAHLVGGDFDFWLVLAVATIVMPIDGIWRLAGIADSEDEDGQVTAGGGVMNIVMPSGGGHLFFIPTWIFGGLASVAICTGFVS